MKLSILKYCCYIAIAIFISSCIKETSYESGANVYGTSTGTLKDSLGNCKGIKIFGVYKKNVATTDSNYVIAGVNISKPGQYFIYSDTVNGFWFSDSGYVAPGTTTVKIKAHGKPIIATVTNFVLNYNNSACLFSVNVLGDIITPLVIYRDYFPTTIGSNWSYDVVGLDTAHTDATSKDTVLGGNTYRVFYAKGNIIDTAFYRKSGNDYYRWDALDGNTGYMPLLFLKDDKPVGTQWESTVANTIYSGIPTQVKMRYSVMEQNVTRNINGNVFDSVIHIKNELQYKIAGTFQTIQTIDSYFAKNVGLVEFNAAGIYHETIRRWKVY
ncbi:MAG: hypothetical protein AMXMBFR79_13910 [Chitinophagaceae bacterium]